MMAGSLLLFPPKLVCCNLAATRAMLLRRQSAESLSPGTEEISLLSSVGPAFCWSSEVNDLFIIWEDFTFNSPVGITTFHHK